MSDYLTDAEYAEEVRCAALGLDGPNAKEYRRVTAADRYDAWRDRAKEHGYRNPLVAPYFCTTCHWSENAHPRDACPTGFVPGDPSDVERRNRELGF